MSQNMASHSPGVTTHPLLRIQDLHRSGELRAVEDLQMRVWGFEPKGVVPAHVLNTVGHHGGILLGAYIGGVLAGFVLGFLGRRKGQLYHASHMLGVHPHYQGHGIGHQLKRRQRDRALEQGLDLMVWTFDPLEARNAYFNIHKLGAISREYHENLYGDLGDRLNQGLPTDRLVVEWRLRLPSGPIELAVEPVSILDEVAGLPELHLERAGSGQPLSVSMPPDIQRLKDEVGDVALAWRLAVRKALSWSFSHGYTIHDVIDGAYLLVVGDLDECDT